MLLKKSSPADFAIPGTVVSAMGAIAISLLAGSPAFLILGVSGILCATMRSELTLEEGKILRTISWFGKSIWKGSRMDFGKEGLISVRSEDHVRGTKWARFNILYLSPEAPKIGKTILRVTGREKALKLGEEISLASGLPFKNEIGEKWSQVGIKEHSGFLPEVKYLEEEEVF